MTYFHLQNRWRKLCQDAFGITSLHAIDHAFNQLSSYYALRSRQYHNLNHVYHCLATQDLINNHSPQLSAALYLHDVQYAPHSTAHTQASANFARKLLSRLGLDQQTIDHIQRLILATAHQSPTQDDQERLIQEIDLSILGATPEKYQRYTSQLRKESRNIPQQPYRIKRRQILNHFLDQDQIFHYPKLNQHLEHQARLNLLQELSTLNK